MPLTNHTFTHILCFMKNVTLSVEESTLREARRIAAQRSTSLNAMIRDFLTELTERESQAAQAKVRIRQLCNQTRAQVGARDWNRQDTHER